MKNRSVLRIVLCIAVLFAVNISSAREKYNWTLGYKPDKIIDYYTPVEGVDLKLHLFNPEDHKPTDKRSCVVFFFGGGWSGGSPDQFYGFGKYLASRGMVAISAQYRTAKQKAIPRNCVEDGREAIRYVREHAGELGVDPNKIAAGGGSAGGHVAAAIAMCPKIDVKPNSTISSLPNALVLYNPVYHNGPEGYGHNRVKGYWKQISPYHNIGKGLPPTVTFFGTKDKCIAVPLIDAFQAKMEEFDNHSVTHKYVDEQHGFFHISKGGRKIFEDVLTKTDAFLVEQGFLSGENAVQKWTAQAIVHFKATKAKKTKQ